MKVRIVMEHHGVGHIEVDGVEVKGVTNIIFRAGVGKSNMVRIDLLADEVEIVSEKTLVRN